MTAEGTGTAGRLAEALLAKWKREYQEETAGLPATTDPEFLSPVSDTSHGELALEYAAALAPTVDALIAEAAAEKAAAELERAVAFLTDLALERDDGALEDLIASFRDDAAALRGQR